MDVALERTGMYYSESWEVNTHPSSPNLADIQKQVF